MRERVKEALPAVIGLALFVAALVVLRRELHALSWPALAADVLDTPMTRLIGAVLLTALNYAVLTGYDFIAFASIGKSPPRLRVAVASFLAYAIANNVGFAMLSGASVRYRFYSRWGVTAEDLSRIVFSYSVTFWLGLLPLGGLSLALSPLPAAREIPAGASSRRSAGCWRSPAYLVATALRRAPLRLGPLSSRCRGHASRSRSSVSAIDWALAGAVFYVLLPPASAFATVLGAFLAAQLLGLASHVPGGVGVFEGLMMLLLRPFIPSADLIAPLVVYRAVYYLLPLSIALVGLVGDELRPAPIADRARDGAARPAVRGAHAEGPRRIHVSRRPGPAVLGRDAGRRGTAGGARPAAAAWGD